MAGTHTHPKNNKKKAIGKSNTTDCGQILSALDIEKASFKLKPYGIDKLNFSFRMDNKGFEWNRKTPKTWTEQITQKHAAKPIIKLFKNTPHYQATIEDFRDIDTFLRVQMNPSKIIHPYHLITDRMVIADQLIGLQKDLERDGIKVQLEIATLNRQLRKQHDETRYWANSQNQFIIYPKNKELSESLSQWQMPDVELTRAEMKLLNSEVIKNKFGHNLMGELISDDEVYSDVFNDYVRGIVFKENQYKTQQIDYGEHYEIYEKLYRKHKNRAFDIFLTITPEFIRRNNELRSKILIPQTKAA